MSVRVKNAQLEINPNKKAGFMHVFIDVSLNIHNAMEPSTNVLKSIANSQQYIPIGNTVVIYIWLHNNQLKTNIFDWKRTAVR